MILFQQQQKILLMNVTYCSIFRLLSYYTADSSLNLSSFIALYKLYIMHYCSLNNLFIVNLSIDTIHFSNYFDQQVEWQEQQQHHKSVLYTSKMQALSETIKLIRLHTLSSDRGS